MRSATALLCSAMALFVAAPARATLTDSEKAQVLQFYAKAESTSAPRVRALLARPDLTPSESGTVFAEAARRGPFDERHLAFVRDMLFGPATQASRSELALTVITGLLSRSAEIAGAAAQSQERADELVRIHRFVAHEIASAGKPPRAGHDVSAGIRDDVLRTAVSAYKAHLSLPVFDRARVAGSLKVARTQAELALVELASGLYGMADVAAWIGADVAERAALEKTGVLVVGLSDAPPSKAANVVQMLDTATAAAGFASALWIDKAWPRGMVGRREVLAARASLAGTKRADPSRLWSSAVEPSFPDAALAKVAFIVGRAAADGLSAADPAFSRAMAGALERARVGGESAFLPVAALSEALDREASAARAAISESDLTGLAAQLLMLDAPRALSAGLSRSLVGHYEPIEQFALALGMLAVGPEGKLKDAVTLGRQGDAGGIAPVEVSRLKGSPAAVERFTLDGHDYALTRGQDGAVTHVDRDGRSFALSSIAFARVPTAAGESWTQPADKTTKAALTFERLLGRPEVGFVDDGRIIVRSVVKTRDAVVLRSSPSEEEVELDLKCIGAPCAVMVRASAGSTGYAGAAVIIEPGEAPHASFVALDGAGKKVPLVSSPMSLRNPGPKGHHVKITLRGVNVEATVDDKTVAAPLPTFLIAGTGDVGFAPGERGDLEVRGLRVGPIRATKPKK